MKQTTTEMNQRLLEIIGVDSPGTVQSAVVTITAGQAPRVSVARQVRGPIGTSGSRSVTQEFDLVPRRDTPAAQPLGPLVSSKPGSPAFEDFVRGVERAVAQSIYGQPRRIGRSQLADAADGCKSTGYPVLDAAGRPVTGDLSSLTPVRITAEVPLSFELVSGEGGCLVKLDRLPDDAGKAAALRTRATEVSRMPGMEKVEVLHHQPTNRWEVWGRLTGHAGAQCYASLSYPGDLVHHQVRQPPHPDLRALVTGGGGTGAEPPLPREVLPDWGCLASIPPLERGLSQEHYETLQHHAVEMCSLPGVSRVDVYPCGPSATLWVAQAFTPGLLSRTVRTATLDTTTGTVQVHNGQPARA